jgi:hypothetical protein
MQHLTSFVSLDIKPPCPILYHIDAMNAFHRQKLGQVLVGWELGPGERTLGRGTGSGEKELDRKGRSGWVRDENCEREEAREAGRAEWRERRREREQGRERD